VYQASVVLVVATGFLAFFRGINMSVSKKIRFEVFKRDGFRCAYCGKSPPEVSLECDHIEPVSKGGKDDLNNLITACFDCNRGKTNIRLDKIPAKLQENSEILKEQEAQLAEYRKFLKKIERRIAKDIKQISDVYTEFFPEYELSTTFKQVSIKRFLKSISCQEIVDAMSKACSVTQNHNDTPMYFCGICWNIIKER